MHVLSETLNNERKEAASDNRGVPSAFARAMKALEGSCTHCSQRAVIANGHGVGSCAKHRHEHETQRTDGIRQRERMRRQIDVARQEHRR